MKDNNFVGYAILVTVCLLMASAGLYLLANFSRLFRGSIRNEFLRRNAAAWLILFFLTAALTPMGGGFITVLHAYGALGIIGFHVLSTTVSTLLGFNLVWAVAESRKLKRLTFLQHKLLVVLTIILLTLSINLPAAAILYHQQTLYLKYVLLSSIYVGGTTGLVYAIMSYQALERKRKSDEKELELSKLRELKAKAELDALHSKINPHFLYNALNSIADLAITDGKKARKMTSALADLFRYSINYNDHNYSTIKEELEMAEVYLQIEKIRFEDKLRYTIRSDESIAHYLVPRFVLQPAVENAVKHGLKVTGSMTEIIIDARSHPGGLELTVADNGPAFPATLSPGYGVKSIYDKLDLLFPGNYEIYFNNDPRKQLTIHIHKLMKNDPGV